MGGKGGGGASQREATAEEKRLWDTQATQLEALTAIAEKQFDLGKEDRAYFEKVFRDGTDTQAKEAIAKIQEKITGKPVDPRSIQGVNVDKLLRDTLIDATPEFKVAADAYIETSNTLTSKYGADVTGISKAFQTGVKGYTDSFSSEIKQSTSNYQDVISGISDKYNVDMKGTTEQYQRALGESATGYEAKVGEAGKEYQDTLSKLAGEAGTIRQDVLSREKGSAYAGIGSAYAEARKQLEQTLSQRGLDTRSGVAQQALASTYQQEAMAKAQAGSQARLSALGQSEAIRAQQAGLAGARYESQLGAAQQQYVSQQAAAQGIYGAGAELARQTAQIALGTAESGYQAGIGAAQGVYGAQQQAGQNIYQAGMGATQGIYGAQMQNLGQTYQQGQAATLQGIGTLTQLAGAGAGYYGGSQNFLAGAAGSYTQGANIAGQSAQGIGQMNLQYQNMKAEQQGAMMGGLMSLAGNLGGAAIIAGSDERAKKNIKYVGDRNGHRWYTWEWNDTGLELGWDKYSTEGVIAQEVAEVMPEAIVTREDGYLMVNYSMIGA